MSLLVPETGLLFWMTIAFGALFFILAKFGFPVITRAIEKRNAYIADSLQAADEARERLAGLQLEADAILAKARGERNDLLDEAQQIYKQTVDKAKADGDRQVRERMERAEADIEELRRKTLDEVRDEVVDLSVRIAEKVIGEKLGDNEQQRMLIERYLKEEEFRKS